ncbi:MAG TPA: hypothetical protein PK156_50995, partial [Polyangium sp.]|nr:hypothetical protein [Polyangium sp.]
VLARGVTGRADQAPREPQTIGEIELGRRAERAMRAEIEKQLPTSVPVDTPVAKANGKAMVKSISKKKVASDGPAKPLPVDVQPMGALAASHAASDPQQSPQVSSNSLEPLRSFKKAAVAIELIWFDLALVDQIRTHAAWKEILSTVKPKPRDADFKDDAPPDKKKDAKNRREMTAILARGDVYNHDELRRAIADAVDEDGMFVPPLVLVSGDLIFPFDEVEALKATLAAVTPFAKADKRLQESVEIAREAMQTPWLQGAGHVAEGLAVQVRDAFGETKRGLPAGYLAAHTERILLEQRHYQKRTVMGQPWIRTLFSAPGSAAALPCYLPSSLAKELPMYERFSVRMVAEARMQLDQYESATIALRIATLGRTLAGGGRS